jgi:hypothetical protein
LAPLVDFPCGRLKLVKREKSVRVVVGFGDDAVANGVELVLAGATNYVKSPSSCMYNQCSSVVLRAFVLLKGLNNFAKKGHLVTFP